MGHDRRRYHRNAHEGKLESSGQLYVTNKTVFQKNRQMTLQKFPASVFLSLRFE